MPSIIILKEKPEFKDNQNLILRLNNGQLSCIQDTSLRLIKLVIPNNVLFIHEVVSYICVHIKYSETQILSNSNTNIPCSFLCFPGYRTASYTEYSCDYAIPIPRTLFKSTANFEIQITHNSNVEYFTSNQHENRIIPHIDYFKQIRLKDFFRLALF